MIRFIHHSHFDPIWRRCWQRAFEEHGLVYQPYAVVEALVIDRWIALAEECGFTFGEGQAAVWRSYFRRNPAQLAKVRDLYDRGRLDLFTCGEVIADSNMPAGETYVRNVLYGILAMREMFGEAGHSSIGWLADAFGNCAQLPQIFKSFGVEYLFRLSYNTPDADHWQGLDGTTIRCREPWQEVSFGANEKLPPCPACRGIGCETCDGYGLDPSIYTGSAEQVVQLGLAIDQPVGAVFYMTEECVPDRQHAEGVRRLREMGKDADFGTYRELLRACPAPPGGTVSTKRDLNPGNTGCYVTRIKIKQSVRRLEYTLMGLECLSAALGRTYDPAPVRDTWRTLCFTLFHDAITGTHVDEAYTELMEMFADVQHFCDGWRKRLVGAAPAVERNGVELALYNALPFPRGVDTVAAPEGLTRGVYRVVCDDQPIAQAVELAAGDPIGLPVADTPGPRRLVLVRTNSAPAPAPTSFDNGHLHVEFDRRWLVSLTDERDGTRLDAPHKRWRPMDLTVEPDVGDPWSTFFDSTQGIYQWALSPYARSCELATVAGGKRLRYTGEYDGPNKFIDRLEFQADFYLWDEAPFLDLHLGIDWDTRSLRLRLAVPVPGKPDKGLYDVPFGHIERERYWGTFRVCGTNGDWPAQTWVSADAGNGRRLTLFNTGTPSHRVQDGVLSCSFVRSPDIPTLLNETAFYEFHGHDGMRDVGQHTFRFRLWPHAATVTPDELTRAGMAFNSPYIPGPVGGPVPQAPFTLDAPGVVPITVKRSEDGLAWIVRLVELRGAPASGTFAWHDQKANVTSCNLLEQADKPLGRGLVPLALRPFEILSLRIEA